MLQFALRWKRFSDAELFFFFAPRFHLSKILFPRVISLFYLLPYLPDAPPSTKFIIEKSSRQSQKNRNYSPSLPEQRRLWFSPSRLFKSDKTRAEQNKVMITSCLRAENQTNALQLYTDSYGRYLAQILIIPFNALKTQIGTLTFLFALF